MCGRRKRPVSAPAVHKRMGNEAAQNVREVQSAERPERFINRPQRVRNVHQPGNAVRRQWWRNQCSGGGYRLPNQFRTTGERQQCRISQPVGRKRVGRPLSVVTSGRCPVTKPRPGTTVLNVPSGVGNARKHQGRRTNGKKRYAACPVWRTASTVRACVGAAVNVGIMRCYQVVLHGVAQAGNVLSVGRAVVLHCRR